MSAQRVEYSSRLRTAQETLPQTLSGGTESLRSHLNADRKGVAVVVADFDGDGKPDLISGYAVDGAGAAVLSAGSP